MKTEIRAIVAIFVVAAFAFGSVSGVAHSWYSDEEKATVTVETGIIAINGVLGADGGSSIDIASPREAFIKNLTPDQSKNLRYTISNDTNVSNVLYRMYYIVEIIANIDCVVKIKVKDPITTSGEPTGSSIINEQTIIESSTVYIHGDENSGQSTRISDGVYYPIEISCDPISSSTSPSPSVSIALSFIVEAYRFSHVFTKPNHIGSGGAINYTNTSSESTFKGTIPGWDDGFGPIGYIDADITFSAGAISGPGPFVVKNTGDLAHCTISFSGVSLLSEKYVIVSLAPIITGYTISKITQGTTELYNGGSSSLNYITFKISSLDSIVITAVSS